MEEKSCGGPVRHANELAPMPARPWAFVGYAFHTEPTEMLFRYGKTCSARVKFAHLSDHQRQGAASNLGEGPWCVEEAGNRSRSGAQKNARVLGEKTLTPRLTVHSRHQRDSLLLER